MSHGDLGVVQVTFIPNSPPMEVDTRGRDFFQERHLSIGWAVSPSISIVFYTWSGVLLQYLQLLGQLWGARKKASIKENIARVCDNRPFIKVRDAWNKLSLNWRIQKEMKSQFDIWFARIVLLLTGWATASPFISIKHSIPHHSSFLLEKALD